MMKKLLFLILLPSVCFGINDWVSPNSCVDVGNYWTYEANSYDGDTTTYCYTAIKSYNHWLELHLPSAIWCDSIRLDTFESGYTVVSGATISVYYDGGWNEIYSGTITEHTWIVKPIPAGVKSVEAVRVSWQGDGSQSRMCIAEFEFWVTSAPPSVGQIFIINFDD